MNGQLLVHIATVQTPVINSIGLATSEVFVVYFPIELLIHCRLFTKYYKPVVVRACEKYGIKHKIIDITYLRR